jgi:hypothetical protein
MAAHKGHKKAGGRKKGTPNKTTADVKAALVAAFDQMGGVKSLTEFAIANPGEFYKLWAKLLPSEVKATVDGTVRLELVEEILDGVPAPDDSQDGETPPEASGVPA